MRALVYITADNREVKTMAEAGQGARVELREVPNEQSRRASMIRLAYDEIKSRAEMLEEWVNDYRENSLAADNKYVALGEQLSEVVEW